ncbi:MAG: cation:dicarboxylase symporter family transporter, partial [Pseudomonadales bacterium]|nr:cation:dicarboxylase symporter family transporter [Pseudomonadales bacterium]
MIDRAALTRNILIAMVGGLLLGSIVHAADLAADNPLLVYGVNGIIDIGGKAFIASLKLLVVPLVFFSLACGASNLSDGSSIGRIGLKTIGLYLLTTAIAITLGLSVANVVNPGMGLSLVTETTFVAKESPPLKEVIIALVPTNPVKAMAEGNMLQVIVFAILLGVAI